MTASLIAIGAVVFVIGCIKLGYLTGVISDEDE